MASTAMGYQKDLSEFLSEKSMAELLKMCDFNDRNTQKRFSSALNEFEKDKVNANIKAMQVVEKARKEGFLSIIFHLRSVITVLFMSDREKREAEEYLKMSDRDKFMYNYELADEDGKKELDKVVKADIEKNLLKEYILKEKNLNSIIENLKNIESPEEKIETIEKLLNGDLMSKKLSTKEKEHMFANSYDIGSIGGRPIIADLSKGVVIYPADGDKDEAENVIPINQHAAEALIDKKNDILAKYKDRLLNDVSVSASMSPEDIRRSLDQSINGSVHRKIALEDGIELKFNDGSSATISLKNGKYYANVGKARVTLEGDEFKNLLDFHKGLARPIIDKDKIVKINNFTKAEIPMANTEKTELALDDTSFSGQKSKIYTNTSLNKKIIRLQNKMEFNNLGIEFKLPLCGGKDISGKFITAELEFVPIFNDVNKKCMGAKVYIIENGEKTPYDPKKDHSGMLERKYGNMFRTKEDFINSEKAIFMVAKTIRNLNEKGLDPEEYATTVVSLFNTTAAMELYGVAPADNSELSKAAADIYKLKPVGEYEFELTRADGSRESYNLTKNEDVRRMAETLSGMAVAMSEPFKSNEEPADKIRIFNPLTDKYEGYTRINDGAFVIEGDDGSNPKKYSPEYIAMLSHATAADHIRNKEGLIIASVPLVFDMKTALSDMNDGDIAHITSNIGKIEIRKTGDHLEAYKCGDGTRIAIDDETLKKILDEGSRHREEHQIYGLTPEPRVLVAEAKMIIAGDKKEINAAVKDMNIQAKIAKNAEKKHAKDSYNDSLIEEALDDILKESKKSADLLNKSARNAIDGKIKSRSDKGKEI